MGRRGQGYKDREARQKERDLEEFTKQVDSGSLVIRQMTEEEKERWAKPPAQAKRTRSSR